MRACSRTPTQLEFVARDQYLEATTTGVDGTTGNIVTQTDRMKPVGGHYFVTLNEEGDGLGPMGEFLFLDGDDAPATQFAISGVRVFGRR